MHSDQFHITQANILDSRQEEKYNNEDRPKKTFEGFEFHDLLHSF